MMQRISSHKKKLKQEPGIVNRIGSLAQLQIFRAALTCCISSVLFWPARPLHSQHAIRRLTTRFAAAYFSSHENKDF